MARNDHALHSMCSYLGGFPPSVPRQLLEKWVPRRTTVLDPFCGSGTTLVEAKLQGRPSIGVDLNPLAVALATAKLQVVRREDVEYRLTELAQRFGGDKEIDDVPETLAPIYHRRTAAQLCYLRNTLSHETPEDIFLRGCVLGIMHGKGRQNGSTAYLSVDMPNTFSMSPEYVRRFVAKNGLAAPAVDVFSKLRERSTWLLRDGHIPCARQSFVLHGDATNVASILAQAGVRTVGAIITSPPYLGILRYGAFNWIRLWFLGYDQSAIDRQLQGTDSLDVYLSFMSSFFASAARVVRPGGIMALVVGDVVENGQHVPLAERVWAELKDLHPFELMSMELDDYDQGRKTTRIWGEDRKGRATPVDRIMVLRRVPSRRRGLNGKRAVAQQRHAPDGASRRR